MLDNLKKMNVVVECCCMCKKSGKSIDHLLIHFAITRKLWNSILNLFGVEWVMPRRVIDLLGCWEKQVGRGTVWKYGGWLRCA